jgi:hypothetical protein
LPSGALVERGGEFITGGYRETERTCERLGLELVGMGIRYPERALRPDPGIDRAKALVAAAAVEAAALKHPGMSALQLLDDVVHDPAVRELFAARIQSSRAHPIDDLDARFLADVSHLLADDEARRVRGGNQLIADRLAARLGSAVRLGTPALSVTHDEGGVRVQTAAGEVDADVAVLAIPVPYLVALPTAPALPSELAGVLARLPMSVAAKLAAPLAESVGSNAIMSVPGRFWAYATPCDEIGCTTVSAWAGAAPVVDALRADDGPETWLGAIRELWPELPPTAGAALVTSWRTDPWSLGAYPCGHRPATTATSASCRRRSAASPSPASTPRAMAGRRRSRARSGAARAQPRRSRAPTPDGRCSGRASPSHERGRGSVVPAAADREPPARRRATRRCSRTASMQPQRESSEDPA